MRVSAVEYHEQAFACGTVDSVVMGKFHKRDPVTPISLSVVDEDSEIFFDLLVDSLCLSISLWVKGGGRVWCDV